MNRETEVKDTCLIQNVYFTYGVCRVDKEKFVSFSVYLVRSFALKSRLTLAYFVSYFRED